MKNLLQLFSQKGTYELSHKERIIERLLRDNHINTTEAVILMKSIDIKIEAGTLEISSGGKIVGGSDFETTDYGMR